MRYPAIYATTFCFGLDETCIAAIIGSMAGVLYHVSLVFFALLLHLKCLAIFYLCHRHGFALKLKANLIRYQQVVQ